MVQQKIEVVVFSLDDPHDKQAGLVLELRKGVGVGRRTSGPFDELILNGLLGSFLGFVGRDVVRKSVEPVFLEPDDGVCRHRRLRY